MTGDELEAVGQTALDRFIEAFNSRHAASWAASLSYPHVRVSPRQAAAVVAADEKTYAEAVSYDAADAMGWHHSAWDSKRVLATSEAKIHASAQWCRFDASGGRIAVNNVSYVITNVGGRWGIQARFGVDSPKPDDPQAVADRAREAWRRLWEAAARGDDEGVGRLVRFPVNLVGVGRVSVATTPAEIVGHLRGRVAGTDMEALQVGRRGVNLGAGFSAPDGTTHHALALVVMTDDDARVSALSLI